MTDNLIIRVTASDSIARTSVSFTLSVAGTAPGLTLVGTSGNDVLNGGAGADTITGGRGDDVLSGYGGNDLFLVSGNAGFDVYDGGEGFDTIRGGAGNDIIGVSGSTGLLSNIEIIDGGGGFDSLRLDNTANVLDLSAITLISIEQITAGGGGDRITGSAGDDVILGGGGNDLLAGGLGNDTFVFSGRQGRDSFDGGMGFDTILGSSGDDVLFLDRGSADLISIEAIDTGGGIDILRTGSGNDLIDLSGIAVRGLERIEAGGGNDRIIGTSASETFMGGAGQDIFVFRGEFGNDTIEDFQLTLGPRRNGDVLDVSDLAFSSYLDVLAHTEQVGQNSVISDPGSDATITLLNISRSLCNRMILLSDAARQPLRRAVTASITAALAVFAVPAQSEECPPTPSEMRSVTGVDSALRFTLDDGSSLRLMSLLMPSSRDLPVPAAQWAPEAKARSAINAMVDQRSMLLAASGAYRDRYNRRVAHAFASGPGEGGLWLQSALVDGGFARVSPLPGETLCLRELFAREAVARAKRAGLWSSPAYEVRSAQDTRTLQALTGTFQIVEGWIAAIGSSRTEVFLNFGRDWKSDFTASVDLKRNADREAMMARLKEMKGRLVRVRGFIEKRNGPFVSLASVDAIEELPEGSTNGR